MQLYIGNKNYSSWSLRAWLMLAKSGISFEETQLELDTEHFYQALKQVTPTLKVPTLVDGDVTVWDSLAICEYINETYLNGSGWPQEPAQRAKARALACEMHSGFMALRNEMPMNIRAKRMVELSSTAKKDIARIDDIFSQCMQATQSTDKGSWLFGQWSITDMMFAPVVMRLITYAIEMSAPSQAYMKHVLACPDLNRWIDAALQETQIVAIDEAGVEI
ncbi:glutathione S-transferase [Pseudoalteromonas ulvae UL12]|uniref:glutathione S-transferase family protein n=1 Tax=Pseudoalteromonas ulvae TaxID=107327 RepID=UPI00186B7931|nr:glutathione S-transferase family protein [Pseudoalteromonas ulvae]MBE0363657.1 glutathione S-transferase [Pseudoalteromonas ulvae UL12]